MIDGEKIKVGGKDMELPPLNWKGCKKFYPAITSNKLNDPEGGVELMPEILYSALVRNYPELTMDQMEEEITPGELIAAIPVLLRLSGFVSGEAARGSAKKK